jgi:NAD(P)-dependent dehydrogenase (short-subunit alcohol dehydrogenase family)
MNLPTFRLDGRNAVVTGAGSGMGRAIAIALAHEGADVVMTELPGKEDAAQQTASQVREHGKRGMVLPLDVTRVDSIQGMVRQVLEEWDNNDFGGNLLSSPVCCHRMSARPDVSWRYYRPRHPSWVYNLARANHAVI